jgi:hypothetical protein
MSSFSLFAQNKDPLPPLDTIFSKLAPTYFEAIRSGVFKLDKDSTWKDLQVHETDAYALKIPSHWLKLGTFGSLVDQSFDASELYFQDTFNAKPVLAGLFILNQPASSLEEAKSECLKGYRSNPDRVFEKNYIDTVQQVTLSSGQEAYLLHTQFFRKSNQFNQSRYDLVVFSEKKKQGYLVMVSIQYNDSTYNFEIEKNLLGFAKKTFSNFSLK